MKMTQQLFSHFKIFLKNSRQMNGKAGNGIDDIDESHTCNIQ